MAPKHTTIHFIRNFTVEAIGGAVKEAAEGLPLSLEITYGAYDNVVPEIHSVSTSGSPPEILILALDIEFFAGGTFRPEWTLSDARAELTRIFSALETVPKGTLILFATFLPPFAITLPWVPEHPMLGRSSAAFSLNQLIRDFVGSHPHRAGLLDLERIAAQIGEKEAIDRRFGLMMKAPFRSGFVTAIAREVVRILRTQFFPAKKVLVLDCDNTLWGGVVGECGVEGIQLDPYEYPGIAFYRFQFEILTLAEQGVLVCLCSKNDEQAVGDVLENHPHCLIKRQHLAGFRINWIDKASNIKSLAEELNLSVDSMVFVDDNPAECELVQSAFPEVSVLRVPSKVYNLPGSLAATGWFDRFSLNPEDAERTKYYQAEQARKDVQKQHINHEGFLQDLEMRAVVRPLTAAEIPRAAQLCQRTNQFNLTTKRYTEADLESLRNDEHSRTYSLQAADRFGPVGFSGLMILRRNGPVIEVDTFLLSCRIIGRHFDRALFCEGLRLAAKDWTFREIEARYIRTPKNDVVSHLWEEYGFQSMSREEPGVYKAHLAGLPLALPSTIKIVEYL